MREASIVRSVIDIAEIEARKHGGLNIRKIKLKVGEFRGVVKEALEFSFAALKKDTPAGFGIRQQYPACRSLTAICAWQ